MEITVHKEGITRSISKLCEKIFNENSTSSRQQPFEVRFNTKIYRHLRNVVYNGLLSLTFEEEEMTVKQRLCIVGYNLTINGLVNKADKLEYLLSKLDMSSTKQCSTFTGKLNDKVHEVEAVLKVLLLLSNKQKLLTPDVCEVWRKSSNVQVVKPSTLCKNTRTEKNGKSFLDYEYFPREIFEVEPFFGVPKNEFAVEIIASDLFAQVPGSGTRWFNPIQKNEDFFAKRTRTTLFNALIHSRVSDLDVTLSLPDLPLDPRFNGKRPIASNMVSDDSGFAGEDSHASDTAVSENEDSGFYDLSIWDKALKHQPSKYHTWEGRKQIISSACKPYITEAGPEILDSLYDKRIWEACYLIDAPLPTFQYLQMNDLIRDGLMVLIGIQSQTFQLDKTSSSFVVSSSVRMSGCSPGSLQLLLKQLAVIGTNYFRLSKFTTCQKQLTLAHNSVLRAFIVGLKKYLHQYIESVVVIQVTDIQSVLELSVMFRKEAYKLKFLADICLCSEGFSVVSGRPKPRFPMGVELLSYLYRLCLTNMCSPVENLLLFLLKVCCTPYLRFLQHWVFKGRCVDMYKEFMIHQNDIYLSSRDKHYWTSGYVMSSKTKMEGVPVFLEDLADDMFTCGKSINLLKLVCPEHYICNHNIALPVINVSYSLGALKLVHESSDHYCNEMMKLEEEKRKKWQEKQNDEKLRRERALIDERQKVNKALAEAQEFLRKSKESLAEKKKEELDFLKRQMEDAIKRKIFDAREADEVDAEFARAASLYEVTTAKLEEKVFKEAKEELLRYYEELTRETEKREQKAVWLQQRRALKENREQFLRDEENKLVEMREEMKEQSNIGEPSQRKQRETKRIHNQETVDGAIQNQPFYSTVQDLIYGSSRATVDGNLSSLTVNIERAGSTKSQTESTIQNLIYPDNSEISEPHNTLQYNNGQENVQTISTNQDGGMMVSTQDSTRESSVEGLLYPTGYLNGNMAAATTHKRTQEQSAVQELLYPTGYVNNTPSIRGGSREQNAVQDLLYPIGYLNVPVTASSRGGNQEESTVQDLLYPTGFLNAPVAASSRGGNQEQSTVQDLLYPIGYLNVPVTASSRGGNQEQSTVQDLLYPTGFLNAPVASTTPGRSQEQSVLQDLLYPTDSLNNTVAYSTRQGSQEQSVVQDLLYPTGSLNSTVAPSTRGRSQEQSAVQDLLYPSGSLSTTTTTLSTRGKEPQSTVQNVLYPGHSDEDSRTISSRGHEPPSTIQKLIYPTLTQVAEREEIKRTPVTHEDVRLATQFEPYPDNFDILDEEPRGDVFLQSILQDVKGLRDDFYISVVEDELESTNDAYDVLCLPVLLQRCVMEPIKAQINLVNSATVRYFMNDLKLVEHFETLKKFLLMEDGEFSFSLSQQLFEKVSSGVTPQQLCSISTLNAIMAHAIQSSVYACQSDNTRSLSFVLQSLPNIYKRNDIGFFDFIQLRYQIEWPVNIVITENCITKYNRIFAFMLRLKRTAWILQDIRYFLKRVDKHANNSPQLRKIHLFRHEMNHFVNDVQGYIANQILHVSWQEFLQSLEHNVRNLDDLHNCHADYLNKALFRALLSKKAAPVMKIISDLFTLVLKFHTQLVSSSWSTAPSSGQVVHPAFSLLCSTHGKFKESTGFVFTVISKLVSRGYQPHLQELLLRLDFNSYYGSNNC